MELNDNVTVILTKIGAEILNGQNLRHRRLAVKYTKTSEEEAEEQFPLRHYEGEILENRLYVILEMFGDHLLYTVDGPVCTDIRTIDDDQGGNSTESSSIL